MRWVVLTDDHPPATGGIAVWTRRVAQGLQAAGHDVQVFARARPGLPDGVRGVWAPRFSRRGHLAMGLALVGRQVPPEQVLCTTWTVVPPGLAGAHVVVHGSDVTRPTHDPARRRRVLARSRVWAVSDWLRRRLRRDHGVEARVLPAPVRVAERPASPGTRWLWAGRAVPGKGGERFLDWLQGAGAPGDVVGTGPLLQPWAIDARARGLDVAFHGWRRGDAFVERLRAARLLALCPDPAGPQHGNEGLGLVGLEALGQGLPVVGVPVGGVPEAVGPGLLVPHPDDADEVALRVDAWWTPERGEEGWAWVRERHGVDRAVATLVDR